MSLAAEPPVDAAPRCGSLFPGGHGETRECILNAGHTAPHVYEEAVDEPQRRRELS